MNFAMNAKLSILFVLAIVGCRTKPPNIKQVGGVVLTYGIEEEKGVSREVMDDLCWILKHRLDRTGRGGVVVEPLGKSRLKISIPGVTPDDAMENYKRLIPIPGRLEFRPKCLLHAVALLYGRQGCVFVCSSVSQRPSSSGRATSRTAS
jgi:hypothetical protein